MRSIKSVVLCSIAAAVLVACGGGGNGDQSPKVKFSSMVTFGDSLSDVGTYAVGGISAAPPSGGGGGKYTVNNIVGGKNLALNWTERIASQLQLPTPCAAETGLDGSTFGTTLSFFNTCRNYAQGGSRVTLAVGPGNKNIPASAALGQLTIPVTTQIDRHLAIVSGAFSTTDLVTVLAGGNDAIINAETYVGTVQGYGAGAASAAATTAVSEMTTAGTNLAALVKTKIVANGAKYVVVINLPDVSLTPYAATAEARIAGSTVVISDMINAFNTALQTGLAGTAGVTFVDAYSTSKDQAANPSAYGLTDVKNLACSATGNILGSATALTCNTSNLIAGDTSHYLYADGVHPTPFGYQLLAQLVTTSLVKAGWL